MKWLFCVLFVFAFLLAGAVGISPSVHKLAKDTGKKISFLKEQIFKIEHKRTLWDFVQDNMEDYLKIPQAYRSFVAKTAYDAGEYPLWAIYATISWESGWNPKAFHNNVDSKTGKIWSIDRGLGQICSAYEKAYVRDYYKGDPKKFNVWNPYDNLQVSIYHMSDLLKAFKGDFYKSLAAYNGGRGMMMANKPKPEVKKYSIRLLTNGGHTEYIPVVKKPIVKKGELTWQQVRRQERPQSVQSVRMPVPVGPSLRNSTARHTTPKSR